MSKSQDYGPWGSFDICFFSILSTAALPWTQKVLMNPPGGNWQGWGIGNKQAPQLILIPRWPVVYPFTCLCLTHVPGIKGPVELDFVL